MLSATYKNRVIKAIEETEGLLQKAKIKHQNSLKCLEMEIEENKELGNPEDSNQHAIDYCNECQTEVERLQAHIQKLKNMLEV